MFLSRAVRRLGLQRDDRPQTFSFACVIDTPPRFRVELILWGICVSRYLSQPAYEKRVFFVHEAPDDLVGWLAERDIASRIMTPVVPESPHCNKLAPFLDGTAADITVVTDADVFFVADPSVFFRSGRPQALPNNHSCPPGHIFRTILEEAGFGGRYRPGVALYVGKMAFSRETYSNNINGGVVGLPREMLGTVAAAWKRWAHWLIAHRDLLGGWRTHVDQVAFALAMAELRLDVAFLPPQVGAILQMLPEIETVYGLHLTTGHLPQYPKLFLADRTLDPTALPAALHDALGRLNDCIAEAVTTIKRLPSTRDHLGLFLNPAWKRG